MMRTIQFAIVEGIEEAGARASRVRLRTAPGHQIEFEPGQAVSIQQKDGVETYYAFATSPSELPEFELIVGNSGPYGDAVFREAPANRVGFSGPVGEAFPLGRMVGRDVLLMGIGTAIAPLRSALQAMLIYPNRYPRTRLLYGCRQLEDSCIGKEIDGWRAAGVDVVVTLSRETVKQEGIHVGYVQQHVEEWIENPFETCVLLCGHPQMVKENTEQLLSLGIPASQIYKNF